MGDELSLLFRLKGENAQLKGVITDTSAAVAQLRQSFGPQLSQTVTVTNKAFSDLGDNLNNFVAQRVPLVGSALVRVTDGLRGVSKESPKTEKAVAGIAKSIQAISTESGKSIPQITSFLTKFVQIEGQAKRDKAAIDFFGASLGSKLIPQLEQTGTALAEVSAETAATGSSMIAAAGPIGIVVAAVIALHVAAAIAAKELFELTRRAADFQGRMFDLAQQTGLAVETLSALEVAAKTTGGSIDTIAQAIVQFQRKLDDAQDPLSKTAEQFRKFKIETSDTETSIRSAFTALSRMPEGFAQTNAAAELFGARGGKQILAILKETNGDLDVTIKRLREASILISEDAARAADKFNDELALLGFQVRALGAAAAEDLIPALAQLIRTTTELVAASRPLISLFSTIAGAAIRPVVQAYKGLSLVVQLLTRDYEGLARAIKEAQDAQDIKPITVPGVAPVPLPSQASPQQGASEAINQSNEILAAVKRNAAAQNQALEEAFQKGRVTRTQEAEIAIATNKRVLEAEQNRINALISQKELEIRALDEAQRNRGEVITRDTEQHRAVTAELVKFHQERLDKESEFEVSSKAIRSKAAKERADSTRNQLANERDILINEFDRTIKDIEAQITRGAKAEEDGLRIIEQIEQAKADERIQSLEKQIAEGFLTIEEQKTLGRELQQLQQEKDRLDDEQRARRLQRERDAAERTREILIGNIDTLLQIEQTAGERRVLVIQALAERRVIAEEEAAKQILKLRLDLIDDEIEATKAKLAAAASLADKDERIRAQVDLNNQIKILTEQRKTIQADGNRDIEAGRRKDIENGRRYADELRDIKERIRDIERDAAEEVIRLMVIHFASRRDIVRARVQADVEDENARHRNATRTIDNLERENRESNKTAKEKLEAEAEINRLREAEAERHRLALQGIKDQGKKDDTKAGSFGGFVAGLSTGQLVELEQGVQSFADVATVAFSAVGAVVNQLAKGVGSLVQQWVLLGSNGPNAVRKMVASVLAGVAAQAATLAIMELAYGVAALTPWGATVYGPAPFHFKAAALFGSIAAIAGVAGRGVAGGLFQPGGAGGTGTSGSSESPRQINPLEFNRNQPPQVNVTVTLKGDDSKLGNFITAHVVKDVHEAGPIREILANDGRT